MTSPIFEIPQCECKVCGYCRTYLENFQWGLDLKEKIGKLKCPNRTMTHPVCPKGQNCLSWRGTDVFEGSTCPNRIFEHATCTQGPNCGLCQGHKFQGPKVVNSQCTSCFTMRCADHVQVPNRYYTLSWNRWEEWKAMES